MSAELPGLVARFRRSGFCHLPGFLQQDEIGTLDLIYEWGDTLDHEEPHPTCFDDKSLLAELSPRAPSLFFRLTPR